MILRYIIQWRACFWCIFFGAPCFFGALFLTPFCLSAGKKERNDTYAERKTAERRKERKKEASQRRVRGEKAGP